MYTRLRTDFACTRPQRIWPAAALVYLWAFWAFCVGSSATADWCSPKITRKGWKHQMKTSLSGSRYRADQIVQLKLWCFSMILHVFPGFSKIFNDFPCFSWFFHDFPWFSMIFLNLPGRNGRGKYQNDRAADGRIEDTALPAVVWTDNISACQKSKGLLARASHNLKVAKLMAKAEKSIFWLFTFFLFTWKQGHFSQKARTSFWLFETFLPFGVTAPIWQTWRQLLVQIKAGQIRSTMNKDE